MCSLGEAERRSEYLLNDKLTSHVVIWVVSSSYLFQTVLGFGAFWLWPIWLCCMCVVVSLGYMPASPVSGL